eukprot:5351319-Pyramimonas_sp.AAC.1
MLLVLCTYSGCRAAAWLRHQARPPSESRAFCRLPELALRKYSHCSSYRDMCCRFPVLNSSCRGGCWAGNHRVDSQTLDACTCRMQRSELGLTLELGLLNCSYYSSNLERCCRFSGCRRATELVQKRIQKHWGRLAVASE